MKAPFRFLLGFTVVIMINCLPIPACPTPRDPLACKLAFQGPEREYCRRQLRSSRKPNRKGQLQEKGTPRTVFESQHARGAGGNPRPGADLSCLRQYSRSGPWKASLHARALSITTDWCTRCQYQLGWSEHITEWKPD